MSWAKVILAFVLLTVGSRGAAKAATISWKGHTWQVTSGGMAGVCQGDPKNVTVDSDGFLHLRIANSGGAWTSSELFTTDRLGPGTYQWQVDGPIDTLDKNVVVGLFPYGPAAGIGTDGTNEIDIEYSRWGQADGPNGDWTDYPASGTTIGELSYTFSLGGTTLSTSRFTWSSSSIISELLNGLQPVGGATGLIKSWTYAPPMPTVNIPQQPLPLGMNLWCFDAPPSNSKPVEVVIRDFVFVPAGGTAGAGGAGGAGGRSGSAGGSRGDGGAGAATGVGGGTAASGGRAGGSAGAGGPSPGTGGGAAGAGSGGAGGAMGASGGGTASGGQSVGTDAGVPSGGTVGSTGGASQGGGGAGGSNSGGCSCEVPYAGSGKAAALGELLLTSAAFAAARRRRANRK